MIKVYTTDKFLMFDKMIEIEETSPLPQNSSTDKPPDAEFVQLQLGKWVVLDNYPTAPEYSLSQFEKDKIRYQKRAEAKDKLIAYMAADNMSRVRNGVWTVSDLTGLMLDPHIAAANNYMSTLSFELAAQAIETADTTLLTSEIRNDWITRLQAQFYLD